MEMSCSCQDISTAIEMCERALLRCLGGIDLLLICSGAMLKLPDGLMAGSWPASRGDRCAQRCRVFPAAPLLVRAVSRARSHSRSNSERVQDIGKNLGRFFKSLGNKRHLNGLPAAMRACSRQLARFSFHKGTPCYHAGVHAGPHTLVSSPSQRALQIRCQHQCPSLRRVRLRTCLPCAPNCSGSRLSLIHI